MDRTSEAWKWLFQGHLFYLWKRAPRSHMKKIKDTANAKALDRKQQFLPLPRGWRLPRSYLQSQFAALWSLLLDSGDWLHCCYSELGFPRVPLTWRGETASFLSTNLHCDWKQKRPLNKNLSEMITERNPFEVISVTDIYTNQPLCASFPYCDKIHM